MANKPDVQWDSTHSHVLLNPRMPAELQNFIKKAKLPELMAHLWLASSGTTATGGVKLIGISKRALLASANAVNQHLKVRAADVWLNNLPHFHVGGLGIFCRAHLTNSEVVDQSDQDWSPIHYVKTLKKAKITLSSLVPTQVYDLVQLGERCPDNVRAIVIGGSALDETVYKQARRLGFPLLPSFGMTECGSQIATADLSTLVTEKDSRKSLEFHYPKLKVLSHLEVKADPQSGRLMVRGESLCSFIARIDSRGNMESRMIGHGEWLMTDDRATITGGYLQPLGRTGEVIKISGELVNIAEMQSLLKETLHTMELTTSAPSTALLALSDKRKGARIILVLPRDLWHKGDEIGRRFNSKVLPVARVREIYYVKKVPKTDLGKIMTGDLAQWLSGR